MNQKINPTDIKQQYCNIAEDLKLLYENLKEKNTELALEALKVREDYLLKSQEK